MTSRKSSNQEPVNDAKGDAKSDKNDLEKALAYVSEMLGDMYSIAVFRKQAPTKHGFPMMRPRWYAPRPYILYRPLCLIVFWQMVCVWGSNNNSPGTFKIIPGCGHFDGPGRARHRPVQCHLSTGHGVHFQSRYLGLFRISINVETPRY